MRSEATLLGSLLAASLALGCSDAARPPTATPPPVTEECRPSATPAVQLGFGDDTFTVPEVDAETTQVFGPQGGSHVFVGARMTGFTNPVEVSFEARDAFTGGRLGSGRRVEAYPTPRADTPSGSCDLRGVLLIFNDRFLGGAGLANVAVTVRDGAGRTASSALRVWLGRKLAQCVPDASATPSLVPLLVPGGATRRDEALPIVADAVLRPVSGGDVLVGGAVRGFAASAVTLVCRLFEETPAGRSLVREVRAAPQTGDVSVVPIPRRDATDCVAPVTVRVPVDAQTGGRALVLTLSADDGLGHSVTEERPVRLSSP